MSVPLARAFDATIGGYAPSNSWAGSSLLATPSRESSKDWEKPRSKLKSPGDAETHGILQHIRRWYVWIFSNGACETRIIVTSRACRCGTTPSIESAIDELIGHPAS